MAKRHRRGLEPPAPNSISWNGLVYCRRIVRVSVDRIDAIASLLIDSQQDRVDKIGTSDRTATVTSTRNETRSHTYRETYNLLPGGTMVYGPRTSKLWRGTSIAAIAVATNDWRGDLIGDFTPETSRGSTITTDRADVSTSRRDPSTWMAMVGKGDGPSSGILLLELRTTILGHWEVTTQRSGQTGTDSSIPSVVDKPASENLVSGVGYLFHTSGVGEGETGTVEVTPSARIQPTTLRGEVSLPGKINRLRCWVTVDSQTPTGEPGGPLRQIIVMNWCCADKISCSGLISSGELSQAIWVTVWASVVLVRTETVDEAWRLPSTSTISIEVQRMDPWAIRTQVRDEGSTRIGTGSQTVWENDWEVVRVAGPDGSVSDTNDSPATVSERPTEKEQATSAHSRLTKLRTNFRTARILLLLWQLHTHTNWHSVEKRSHSSSTTVSIRATWGVAVFSLPTLENSYPGELPSGSTR